MSSDPVILEDRLPLAVIGTDYPDIVDLLATLDTTGTGNRDRAHFCGLVHASTECSVFFLPRNMGGTDRTHGDSRYQARLTMRALARYGRETASRTGTASEDGDHSRLVAVIEEIAEDFLRYGIYSERTRIRSRNSGKPDWKRTIQLETPLITGDGGVVFPELRTSRTLDSHNNPLSRIQAAILREIFRAHDWWLECPQGLKRDLASYDNPLVPRTLWGHALRSLLPSLYANRPIGLVRLLLRYLDELADVRPGRFLTGVGDFERVWESMLRDVLPGEESASWNSRLPKPAYLDGGGVARTIRSGMEMDIVVRRPVEGRDHLHILDAKYYAATGTGSVPKTGDIVKQLMYEMALKAVIADMGTGETVSGGFVFPAGGTHARPFVRAGLTRGQTLDYRFPSIRIHYVDIESVMSAYVNRRSLETDLVP